MGGDEKELRRAPPKNAWHTQHDVHLGRVAFERGDPEVDFSRCFTLFFAPRKPVASNLPKMAPEIPNIAAKIFNVALKIP